MKRVLNWIGSAKGKGSGFSLISAGNLLIAFFTYLRFAEITRIYGTSWETDAVAIAMVIPILLQKLISTAFGIAFLPIYSRVRHKKGEKAANLLVSRIITWMSITGVIIISAVVVFGRTFSGIVGPGASDITLSLATRMLYVFFPLIFLNAIEGMLQNFLNYQNRYGLVSIVRVLQILVSYIVLVLGHRYMDIMIIPVSGLVGAFVSFSVCAGFAFRLRLRLRPKFDPRDRDFRELIKLAIPILVGVTTGFMGPVADKALASFLRASSVTAIDYAARIKNMVRLLLIQPMIVLSTVSLSKVAAEGDLKNLRRELVSFINLVSYYAVPVAGILVVLSTQFTSIFFQRGNFGPDESRMVGYALAFYSPWFAQLGIALVLRKTFFALKDSKTPVLIGIWAMIVNVLLNIILIGPLGIGGLALATTVSSSAKALLLLYFLRKRMNGIGGSEFMPELLKILLGTGAMITTMLAAGSLFPFRIAAPLWDRIFNVCLSLIPAFIVYVSVTALTGSRTYRRFSKIILNKVFGERRGKRG